MFGADIEFFIKNPKTGRPTPACGKIGGTKEKPIPLDGEFSILEDGAAVELNYKPAATYTEFRDRIVRSAAIISKHTGYEVYDGPETNLPGLAAFKQANEIGCMPDFDAYSPNPLVDRPIPDIKEFGKLRFAGGHIHLSYEVKKQIPSWVVARFIDYFMTIPFLSYVHDEYGKEEGVKMIGKNRSKYYGWAGLHRDKPYGVEYRVLSNHWATAAHYAEYVGSQLEEVMYYLKPEKLNKLNDLFLEVDWPTVKHAIDSLDFPEMQKIAYGVRNARGR